MMMKEYLAGRNKLEAVQMAAWETLRREEKAGSKKLEISNRKRLPSVALQPLSYIPQCGIPQNLMSRLTIASDCPQSLSVLFPTGCRMSCTVGASCDRMRSAFSASTKST